YGCSVPLRTSTGAGRLDFHERDETVDFGLIGRQPGQDAGDTERFIAELRTHPVLARGSGIALVVDEIEDFENRADALSALLAAGHLEGNMGIGQGFLGANDALLDRWLGQQVR